ncbi:unnamed protein product [Symbiodinium microadriaticum]|nr:unnamed protein product [Symbiodinium microadriaticum]
MPPCSSNPASSPQRAGRSRLSRSPTGMQQRSPSAIPATVSMQTPVAPLSPEVLNHVPAESCRVMPPATRVAPGQPTRRLTRLGCGRLKHRQTCPKRESEGACELGGSALEGERPTAQLRREIDFDCLALQYSRALQKTEPLATPTELDEDDASQLWFEVAALLAPAHAPESAVADLALGRLVAISKPGGGTRGLIWWLVTFATARCQVPAQLEEDPSLHLTRGCHRPDLGMEGRLKPPPGLKRVEEEPAKNVELEDFALGPTERVTEQDLMLTDGTDRAFVPIAREAVGHTALGRARAMGLAHADAPDLGEVFREGPAEPEGELDQEMRLSEPLLPPEGEKKGMMKETDSIKKFEVYDEVKVGEEHSVYRAAVGRLLWLALVRSDIAYATKELGRDVIAPTVQSVAKCGHLLQFLYVQNLVRMGLLSLAKIEGNGEVDCWWIRRTISTLSHASMAWMGIVRVPMCDPMCGPSPKPNDQILLCLNEIIERGMWATTNGQTVVKWRLMAHTMVPIPGKARPRRNVRMIASHPLCWRRKNNLASAALLDILRAARAVALRMGQRRSTRLTDVDGDDSRRAACATGPAERSSIATAVWRTYVDLHHIGQSMPVGCAPPCFRLAKLQKIVINLHLYPSKEEEVSRLKADLRRLSSASGTSHCPPAAQPDGLKSEDSEGNNVLEQDSLREAAACAAELPPPPTGTHSFSDISKPDMSPADAEVTQEDRWPPFSPSLSVDLDADEIDAFGNELDFDGPAVSPVRTVVYSLRNLPGSMLAGVEASAAKCKLVVKSEFSEGCTDFVPLRLEEPSVPGQVCASTAWSAVWDETGSDVLLHVSDPLPEHLKIAIQIQGHTTAIAEGLVTLNAARQTWTLFGGGEVDAEAVVEKEARKRNPVSSRVTAAGEEPVALPWLAGILKKEEDREVGVGLSLGLQGVHERLRAGDQSPQQIAHNKPAGASRRLAKSNKSSQGNCSGDRCGAFACVAEVSDQSGSIKRNWCIRLEIQEVGSALSTPSNIITGRGAVQADRASLVEGGTQLVTRSEQEHAMQEQPRFPSSGEGWGCQRLAGGIGARSIADQLESDSDGPAELCFAKGWRAAEHGTRLQQNILGRELVETSQGCLQAWSLQSVRSTGRRGVRILMAAGLHRAVAPRLLGAALAELGVESLEEHEDSDAVGGRRFSEVHVEQCFLGGGRYVPVGQAEEQLGFLHPHWASLAGFVAGTRVHTPSHGCLPEGGGRGASVCRWLADECRAPVLRHSMLTAPAAATVPSKMGNARGARWHLRKGMLAGTLPDGSAGEECTVVGEGGGGPAVGARGGLLVLSRVAAHDTHQCLQEQRFEEMRREELRRLQLEREETKMRRQEQEEWEHAMRRKFIEEAEQLKAARRAQREVEELQEKKWKEGAQRRQAMRQEEVREREEAKKRRQEQEEWEQAMRRKIAAEEQQNEEFRRRQAEEKRSRAQASQHEHGTEPKAKMGMGTSEFRFSERPHVAQPSPPRHPHPSQSPQGGRRGRLKSTSTSSRNADLRSSSAELQAAKAAAMRQLIMLKQNPSKEARHKGFKELLRLWHPDKNPGSAEVATTVFQMIQAERGRVFK